MTSRSRCVMKSTDLPSRLAFMTANTRSARSEGARDLVQDQELRVASERPTEVEHPQQGQGHVTRELTEVDLEIQRPELVTDRRDRDPRQSQVLRDGQVGNEGRILEDECEPEPGGVLGRARPDRCAGDGDRPRVGPEHAGQRLHERALARSVRSQEGVYLARNDLEIGRAEGDHGAEALRDPASLLRQVQEARSCSS